MPVSDEYRDFVLEQLDDLGHLTHKRMFGGVGIWCDGLFFAIIADNVAYLKVDDGNRQRFEERGMGPFRIRDGRSSLSYYEIPADVLENAEELVDWARQSVNAAARAAGDEQGEWKS